MKWFIITVASTLCYTITLWNYLYSTLSLNEQSFHFDINKFLFFFYYIIKWNFILNCSLIGALKSFSLFFYYKIHIFSWLGECESSSLVFPFGEIQEKKTGQLKKWVLKVMRTNLSFLLAVTHGLVPCTPNWSQTFKRKK